MIWDAKGPLWGAQRNESFEVLAEAPSNRFVQTNAYELLHSWWRHRVSFLVIVGITVAALALYYFTFLGERPTPIFSFLQRLEFVVIPRPGQAAAPFPAPAPTNPRASCRHWWP